MKRIAMLCCIMLLLVPETGCWNLREPDDLAFIIGAGLDLSKDGKLEVSSQVAVPAGLGSGEDSGGSRKKSFVVVSATGKNFMDAGQNLQAKLSRSLFYAHRQTILIGRQMAQHGIGNFTDMIVRNPKSEMRSTIMVVKNAKAKDVLAIDPIFDPFISVTFVRDQVAVGMKPYYYRQFLSDTLREGIEPLLPAVSLTPEKKYFYAGAALLDSTKGLKLTGFLDKEESYRANWILGRQNAFTVTSFLSQGEGTVSLRLQQLKRKIRVRTGDKGLRFEISLKGTGTIVENNSKLDPSKRKDLRIIEDELGKDAEQSVRQLVAKVQGRYKTDVFGFGEHVHRQLPQLWNKTLRHDWNETFPQVQVTVKVRLKCKDPGQTNVAM